MNFGLQIWSRTSQLLVDTTTISWNLADVAELPAGAQYSKRFDELKDYDFLCSVMINGVVDYNTQLSTPMPSISLGADGVTTVTKEAANVSTILLVLAR